MKFAVIVSALMATTAMAASLHCPRMHQKRCGTTCVDLMTDPSHCGTCHRGCGSANRLCSGGECVPTRSNGDGEVGDPCTKNANCGDGLRCVNAKCAVPVKGGQGDTCTKNVNCATGFFCDDGQCAPRDNGGGDGGDTCSTDADCDGIEICLASTGLCVAPGDIGDSCSTDSDCGIGLECDENDTCALPGIGGGGLGDTCTTNAACDNAFICVLGICATLGQAGDSCGTRSDCEGALLCVANLCVAL